MPAECGYFYFTVSELVFIGMIALVMFMLGVVCRSCAMTFNEIMNN